MSYYNETSWDTIKALKNNININKREKYISRDFILSNGDFNPNSNLIQTLNWAKISFFLDYPDTNWTSQSNQFEKGKWYYETNNNYKSNYKPNINTIKKQNTFYSNKINKNISFAQILLNKKETNIIEKKMKTLK